MKLKNIKYLSISLLLSTGVLLASTGDKNNLDFAQEIVALNIDDAKKGERQTNVLTDDLVDFSNSLEELNLSKKDKDKILQAVEFAAKCHHNQFRNNSKHAPYLTHPVDVALVLIKEGKVIDPVVIQAAILHDCLAANPEAKDSLKKTFGDEVANIINELSFSPRLPLVEKKRLELEKSPKLSKNAKLIKLSDRIVNLKELKENPPENWSRDKIQSYLLLSDALFKGLKGTNSDLEKTYKKLLDEEYKSS